MVIVNYWRNRWGLTRCRKICRRGRRLAGLCLPQRQVSYWKNSYVLFEHALAATNNDNFVAHYALGQALSENENFDQAIYHYKESLPERP